MRTSNIERPSFAKATEGKPTSNAQVEKRPQRVYWDQIADDYQTLTEISTDDFHFGPLLPGDRELDILPEITPGMTCLELGCGAAQNSIYLAKRGATCTAIDISLKQIEHAQALADKNSAAIDLRCLPLEDAESWPEEQFDLVHSVFALPFVETPEAFIQRATEAVAPGGTLLLATGHPVFAAEWLEVDDGEMGYFLPSYFEPPEDLRQTEDGRIIGSSSYPVSTVSEWIHAAGLRELRIWEPQPLPLESVTDAPYHSPAWIDLYPKLAAAPVAIIYRAERI